MIRVVRTMALLASLAALAPTAAPQGRGAGGGAAGAPPVPTVQQGKGPRAEAQAQEGVRKGTQQGAQAGRGPEWQARARVTARSAVRHESTLRRRIARIERMQELYRARGRTDRVRALGELRTRAENVHRQHVGEARGFLGDAEWNRLQERIREQDRVRRDTRTRTSTRTNRGN